MQRQELTSRFKNTISSSADNRNLVTKAGNEGSRKTVRNFTAANDLASKKGNMEVKRQTYTE